MATGNITQVGDTVSITLDRCLTVIVLLSGTYQYVRLAFEWRRDSSDYWKRVLMVRSNDLNIQYESDSVSSQFPYFWSATLPQGGDFRVRCIEYYNGTPVVSILESATTLQRVTDAVDIAGRAQQTLAVSTSAAHSSAFTEDGVYDVWCDEGAVWMKHAATANDVTTGNGYKLQVGNTVPMRLFAGLRLGGIMSSGSGTLRWHRSQ